MSGVHAINEQRETLWLKNAAAYRFQRFFKGGRNENLWVFGAWEGKRYCDNSRSLFEYVVKRQPNIRAVWIAQDEKVCEQIRSLGFKSYLADSVEGKSAMRNAGVAFFTNGLDDFGPTPLVYGAFLVNLFHGVGFKKVYREQVREKKSFRQILGRIKRIIFDWVKCDALVTTSPYMEERYRKAFEIGRRKPAIISGQPRTDAFVLDPRISDCISETSPLRERMVQANSVILFMPTWSDGDNDKLMNAMNAIARNGNMQSALERGNALLVLKPHYLSEESTRVIDGRVCCLSGNDVVDNDGLMAASSALITDFSSCVVDYAITGKPTAYYQYRALTGEESASLFDGYFELFDQNGLVTVSDLASFVSKVIEKDPSACRLSSKLNRIFSCNEVKPGKCSEKAFESVRHLVECRN